MAERSPSPPSMSLTHPLSTSAMLLVAAHCWGLNPVHPMLSLGHSQEPTSPHPLSKDLPLPGVLPSAHAATKLQQRRAPLDLHRGHQPCDSATGMTAVSALPPGARLHHVPVPRTLQSRCIGRCRTGGHGQSGRQKPCSWQSSHPCTQKQVLTSTEKCMSLI